MNCPRQILCCPRLLPLCARVSLGLMPERVQGFSSRNAAIRCAGFSFSRMQRDMARIRQRKKQSPTRRAPEARKESWEAFDEVRAFARGVPACFRVAGSTSSGGEFIRKATRRRHRGKGGKARLRVFMMRIGIPMASLFETASRDCFDCQGARSQSPDIRYARHSAPLAHIESLPETVDALDAVASRQRRLRRRCAQCDWLSAGGVAADE